MTAVFTRKPISKELSRYLSRKKPRNRSLTTSGTRSRDTRPLHLEEVNTLRARFDLHARLNWPWRQYNNSNMRRHFSYTSTFWPIISYYGKRLEGNQLWADVISNDANYLLQTSPLHIRNAYITLVWPKSSALTGFQFENSYTPSSLSTHKWPCSYLSVVPNEY
jgi:hypothetical protein